jgi:hypothetical protein
MPNIIHTVITGFQNNLMTDINLVLFCENFTSHSRKVHYDNINMNLVCFLYIKHYSEHNKETTIQNTNYV